MESCRDPRPNLGLGKLEFTNKHYSAATGLYYYFDRWCDPTVGRFVNQVPLPGHAPDPQSLNPYVYVENTPTSLVDHTGAYDEYSYNREIGSVFLPDKPPIINTADFFKNIEKEYLVESENPARIAPITGTGTQDLADTANFWEDVKQTSNL